MGLLSRFSSSKKSPDLSGEWSGYYGYGEQYPDSMRDTVVHFVARITSVANGEFEGSITEDENGIPETSRIAGRVRGNRIEFKKTYARTYAVDNDGKTNVAADVPQDIFYKGFYDESENKVKGQWQITITYIDKSNGETFDHVSAGHWSMEKPKSVAQ